jgi:ferredoxin
MIDRSALVRDTFESSKSFERKEVWVVKCAGCGKVYGNEKGAILFRDIEKALSTIAESKDWWIVRDCGVKVLCSECVQKLKERMEDEVSADIMILA